MTDRHVPEATVARLPVYLQALVEASDGGVSTLSSDELARRTGVNSAKVRKDLSFLGTYGTRGVGYRVTELAAQISQVLGLTGDQPIVIVGLGNLGRALASYDGFTRRGFRIAALFDADPKKVGMDVAGVPVSPIEELSEVLAAHAIATAVVAVPAVHAQQVADALVAGGITAILNFAPIRLEVPDTVSIRTVDLSTEMQILSFYQQAGENLSAAAG